jgi:hypothetical protein
MHERMGVPERSVSTTSRGQPLLMDRWGVLVWNMGLMSPGRSTEANMAYLSKLIEVHAVKVALVNEASVHYLRQANSDTTSDGSPPPFVFSEEGIKGRDYWTDEHGVRKLKDRTRWSAAVMSPLGPHMLGEGEVRARRPYRTKDVDIPFTNSRPGTWMAATVAMGNQSLTCVSLYGLIEELTDASMHRSLSEISPIFSDPEYKELVLLGGDFNISTALTDPSAREQSRIVLDRIKAYKLVDCLEQWRNREGLPRMAGCTCEDEDCHTLTRLEPNRPGADLPWEKRTSPQVDYLFASEALASRLDEIVEIPPEEWEPYSDHSPIIAKFRAI